MQIPVCLWFLARDRENGRFRDRRGETLFLDARKLGVLIDRVHRVGGVRQTEEHFAKALQKALQQVHAATRSDPQRATQESEKPEKTAVSRALVIEGMEDRGLEPLTS
jgi:type I restriction-modification system DNA methylase subunit